MGPSRESGPGPELLPDIDPDSLRLLNRIELELARLRRSNSPEAVRLIAELQRVLNEVRDAMRGLTE